MVSTYRAGGHQDGRITRPASEGAGSGCVLGARRLGFADRKGEGAEREPVVQVARGGPGLGVGAIRVMAYTVCIYSIRGAPRCGSMPNPSLAGSALSTPT
jgi:hypothetical protein